MPGDGLNWELARIPDFARSAIAYQQAGQERRKEEAVQSAYAKYAGGDLSGINELMAYAPKEAIALRDDAAKQATLRRQSETRAKVAPMLAEGKYGEAARIGAADLPDEAKTWIEFQKNATDEQVRLAKAGNEVWAAAWPTLKELPKGTGARQEAYNQLVAPHLKQAGFPDDQITVGLQSVDNDAFGESSYRLALGAEKVLAQQNSDRDFGLKKEDQQFDNTLAREGLDETKRTHRVGESYEGARLNLSRQAEARQAATDARISSGGLSPAQSRKAETDLRKEFDGLPEVKSYRTISGAAGTVQALAKADPSPQNDIALIYSTMKAYDPTSVVRETEFATAQNAVGVPDQIRNAWNKALRGQRLNPRQRQEMASSVGAVAGQAKKRFDEIEGQYRGYASEYGVSSDRVAPKAPAATQTQTVKTPWGNATVKAK